MEETDAPTSDGNTPQQSETYPWTRFLIDLGTLVVLTITMIYIIKYAGAASEQNRHLADSVAQHVIMTRPVIIENRTETAELKEGIPSEGRIFVQKFGKSVAPVGLCEMLMNQPRKIPGATNIASRTSRIRPLIVMLSPKRTIGTFTGTRLLARMFAKST
jgi:hypothetical protein